MLKTCSFLVGNVPPNFPFFLEIKGKNKLEIQASNFSTETLKPFVEKTGQLLYCFGAYSPLIQSVEFFFASFDPLAASSEEIIIAAPKAPIISYITRSSLMVPKFNHLQINSKAVCRDLAYKYPLTSFQNLMEPVPELPYLVLSHGTVDGVLASFGNIPLSWTIVDDFKARNWARIKYRGKDGFAKNEARPAGGWI